MGARYDQNVPDWTASVFPHLSATSTGVLLDRLPAGCGAMRLRTRGAEQIAEWNRMMEEGQPSWRWMLYGSLY